MQHLRSITTAAALTAAAHAGAQPINLDASPVYASPGDDYGAAADQPGHWNVTDGTPTELDGLDGAPSGVMLSFPLGAGGGIGIDDPFLDGDVHALLDDAFVTGDVVQRLRFEGLEPGAYDMYAYASPLDQGTVTTFLFMTGGDNEFFNVPGGWDGALEEGLNYARATIDVPDGTIDLDFVSGLFGDTGYLSGVQIVPADCGADVNGDGELDILDFIAFQNLFTAGDPDADCDNDGMLNILDFICYQALFQDGCP